MREFILKDFRNKKGERIHRNWKIQVERKYTSQQQWIPYLRTKRGFQLPVLLYLLLGTDMPFFSSTIWSFSLSVMVDSWIKSQMNGEASLLIISNISVARQRNFFWSIVTEKSSWSNVSKLELYPLSFELKVKDLYFSNCSALFVKLLSLDWDFAKYVHQVPNYSYTGLELRLDFKGVPVLIDCLPVYH